VRLDVTDALPRRGRRRYLRRLVLTLAIVGLSGLVLAPSAFAGFITPKSGGSPNADQIASLYKVVLYIAAVVFVIVEGALLYSVYKFRAKKGAVAAQIHGNTRLEIGWTVAAALILVALTVVTFVKLPAIINPPNSSASGIVLSASTTRPTPPNGKTVTICVQGRQFIWRYIYGNNCLNGAFSAKLPYSYQTMYAPANTTVVLDIQSTDVIHSWWVPSLGGKVDAVPGYTTYTWFKAPNASSPGHTVEFHGQCAQLCGRSHAAMTAIVQILSPADYKAWLARQNALINAANNQVTQLRAILTASGNLGG
jgi:cytochrome c oxidase subunit II